MEDEYSREGIRSDSSAHNLSTFLSMAMLHCEHRQDLQFRDLPVVPESYLCRSEEQLPLAKLFVILSFY
jgi:hypothetical protein